MTQLVEVLHHIGSQLDYGKQTDVIYLDMSKAFDKVNHAILIDKLRSFNIDGNLLKWFGSYLQNRRQRVTVLGATSTQLPVTSGVPQGSILGPMLFLLYVNDLIEGVKASNVASFAVDIKIYKSIESLSDAVPLQADLRSLESRAEASGLVLSEDKCSCQRISRKKTPLLFSYSVKNKVLPSTTQEKDLGVWVTSNLTWKKQTLDQCAQANKLLGYLNRSATDVKNVSTRRTLYLAVVRPTLEYATQVWSPQSIDLIKRAERIQRRATKFILNLPYMCSENYKERLVLSNLIPISYWHEYLDVLFFKSFKSINKHVFLSENTISTRLKPSRPTRSVQSPNIASFKTSKCRATTFQRSFINRTVRIWNLLPSEVRDSKLSLPHFKNLLLKHYNSATSKTYDEDNPRTWKSICPKCNVARCLTKPVKCCF